MRHPLIHNWAWTVESVDNDARGAAIMKLTDAFQVAEILKRRNCPSSLEAETVVTEYIIEIKSGSSLQDIELAIQREESNAEFLRGSISYHEHAIRNLVTFNALPAGQRPQKPVTLARQDDPAPAGKKSIWTGVILVSGSSQAVVAYR